MVHLAPAAMSDAGIVAAQADVVGGWRASQRVRPHVGVLQLVRRVAALAVGADEHVDARTGRQV